MVSRTSREMMLMDDPASNRTLFNSTSQTFITHTMVDYVELGQGFNHFHKIMVALSLNLLLLLGLFLTRFELPDQLIQ